MHKKDYEKELSKKDLKDTADEILVVQKRDEGGENASK